MIISIDAALAKTFTYELTKEQISEMKIKAKKYATRDILAVTNLLAEVQNKIKASFIPQLPLELAIVKLNNTLKIQYETEKKTE